MSAATYSVTITCEQDGCENAAMVLMQALGEDETSLLCAACVTKIGRRLEAAESQLNELLSSGVDERMARRVVGARIDRKEV